MRKLDLDKIKQVFVVDEKSDENNRILSQRYDDLADTDDRYLRFKGIPTSNGDGYIFIFIEDVNKLTGNIVQQELNFISAKRQKNNPHLQFELKIINNNDLEIETLKNHIISNNVDYEEDKLNELFKDFSSIILYNKLNESLSEDSNKKSGRVKI